jgi:predicted transglutaminase-like cysteine proteinase
VGALFRLPPRMKDKAKELVGSFIDLLERTTQSSRRPMRAPDLQRPTRELACRKEGVTHKARSYISIAAMVLAASFTAPAMAQSLESAQSAARRLVKAPRGFTDSCERYQWLCESQTASASPLDDAALDVAKKVNSRVNFWASEISDPENYGAAEYWALPTNGNGDCEDFVLQKYKLLLDMGVESRNLSIAVVLDWRGDNHAVLILRHRSGDLVLDSLSSRIKPWNLTGYTFLAMQSGANKTQWEVVMNQSRDSNVLALR